MDTLRNDNANRNQQQNGICEGNEDGAFLVAIGVSRIAVHLYQMQPDDDQYQREHIAKVVSRVAQQREAVLPDTNAGFHSDKKKVQHNGHPKDFAHLFVVGRRMMMVMLVMMMFVFHTIFVNSAKIHLFRRTSNPH